LIRGEGQKPAAVMPRLGRGIHEFSFIEKNSWMLGPSPSMTFLYGRRFKRSQPAGRIV